MGEEPDPEEAPLRFEELPFQCQTAYVIFTLLSDRWEGMSGTFLGKDFSALTVLFDAYEIEAGEEKREILHLLKILEHEYSNFLESKKNQKEQIEKEKGEKWPKQTKDS